MSTTTTAIPAYKILLLVEDCEVDEIVEVVAEVDRFDEVEVVETVELLDVGGTDVEEDDVAPAGSKFAKAVLFIICAPYSMYPEGQFVQY